MFYSFIGQYDDHPLVQILSYLNTARTQYTQYKLTLILKWSNWLSVEQIARVHQDNAFDVFGINLIRMETPIGRLQ